MSAARPYVRSFYYRNGKFFEYGSKLVAYSIRFTGGVSVASANINTSPAEELIIAPLSKAVSSVKEFSNISQQWSQIGTYQAFSSKYRGGAVAAAIDYNFDGRDEILTAINSDSQPYIKIKSADGKTLLRKFLAFSHRWVKGINVAVGEKR